MSTKPCYGNMLPDFEQLTFNRTEPGQVFSVFVRSFGIGLQEKKIEFHPDGWERCQQCERYAACRDLCMLKLGVHLAMRHVN